MTIMESLRGMHMAGPRFDPTINWGHVLTAATIAGTALIGGLSITAGFNSKFEKIDRIDERVGKVETAISLLTNIQVTSARFEERLTAIDRRVDAVERIAHAPERRP